MKWLISRLTTEEDARVIDAPSWFDAHAWAMRVFQLGPDEVKAEQTTTAALPTVQLEWRGSDAGRVPGRRLWVRVRKGGRWSPWREA